MAGDDNNAYDVFLVDRDPDDNGLFDEGNDALELVSVALSGGPGNSSSDRPSLSDDGSRVAFGSWASDLVESDVNGHYDAFVRDRARNVTLLVSVADDGTQTWCAAGSRRGPARSARVGAAEWIVAASLFAPAQARREESLPALVAALESDSDEVGDAAGAALSVGIGRHPALAWDARLRGSARGTRPRARRRPCRWPW